MNKKAFVLSAFLAVFLLSPAICQEEGLELTLDLSAKTVPLPDVFKPNIDLSGRGFHEDMTWPQTLSSKDTLATWQQDIGFRGIYRMQYNLWEINQLAKDKELSDKLVSNYESIIKRIFRCFILPPFLSFLSGVT